jgi:hypothetical protein
MTTTSYDTLNNLDDLVLIGGTDKLLTFIAYHEDGVNLLNITGGSAEWRLCPYGEFSVNILHVHGTIATANTFTIQLTAAQTLTLAGKYIQQTIITDFYGKTFRPGQGVVLILPAIVSA